LCKRIFKNVSKKGKEGIKRVADDANQACSDTIHLPRKEKKESREQQRMQIRL